MSPMPSDSVARLWKQVHAAWVIAKKDAAVYYLKPPVLSFGIIFPAFYFLAFAAGREAQGSGRGRQF